MAAYSTNNAGGSQQNLTSSFKTLASLTAATASLTSAKIFQVYFCINGTPNPVDCTVEYDLSQQTAAGTGTAYTPFPDPGSRAAGTVAVINYTAEGTITASSAKLYKPLNQRAALEWYATPGDEIPIPATNLSGWAGRAKSATYASTAVLDIMHRE